MAPLIKYIQVPVSPEEFDEIDKMKGKLTWREYGLPRLRITDLKKVKA